MYNLHILFFQRPDRQSRFHLILAAPADIILTMMDNKYSSLVSAPLRLSFFPVNQTGYPYGPWVHNLFNLLLTRQLACHRFLG
jgi:hypothetical protein